ncbi:ATP-dependent DNA ligase [Phyllobacterium sp. YR620]|nr:ATP-dependent DNA ligase [Phyllobacterium sp. YR620]
MIEVAKRKMSRSAWALPLDTQPMEARSAETLPADGGWQYEPKWDGFRCLAFKDGTEVDLRAKSGKPLGRFFPEMVELLAALPVQRFVIDGELVIESGGALSFQALQMRLHPAESRVRKLAAETPSRLVVFDMLMNPDGKLIMDSPLTVRNAQLSAFLALAREAALTQSPHSSDIDEARIWLENGYAGTDGVVCKRLDGLYLPGERVMIKVKRLKSADCVVGGFRYEHDSKQVGSLLLGLYNSDGKLDHVGYTSTITDKERGELTEKLEALVGPPGFTGKAPGGPSRWSTERSGEWQPLKPQLVVEVRFDHVSGDRFRHGTKLLRWRPDKSPRQCTYEQLRSVVH